MADLVATDVPDLEMERLYREGDVEGMLRRVQQPLARGGGCAVTELDATQEGGRDGQGWSSLAVFRGHCVDCRRRGCDLRCGAFRFEILVACSRTLRL